MKAAAVMNPMKASARFVICPPRPGHRTGPVSRCVGFTSVRYYALTVADELITAVTEVLEQVLTRGVEIQPRGEGWLVRLTPADVTQGPAVSEAETAQMRRSW